MAQLRQNYAQFVARDAEIVVVGPDDDRAFAHFWARHHLPFIGLPDPQHKASNLYGQQVKLLKFGRMPALVVIDKQGHIRFRHYANSMSDIVPDRQILDLLDELNDLGRTAVTSPPKQALQFG